MRLQKKEWRLYTYSTRPHKVRKSDVSFFIINFIRELREKYPKIGKEKIKPHFSYPRCPKINAFIERYNRTIQEEFIDNNIDIIFDKQLFHEKLADYLIFYNTKRPHKSLGLKSPIDYLIEN